MLPLLSGEAVYLDKSAENRYTWDGKYELMFDAFGVNDAGSTSVENRIEGWVNHAAVQSD